MTTEEQKALNAITRNTEQTIQRAESGRTKEVQQKQPIVLSSGTQCSLFACEDHNLVVCPFSLSADQQSEAKIAAENITGISKTEFTTVEA